MSVKGGRKVRDRGGDVTRAEKLGVTQMLASELKRRNKGSL